METNCTGAPASQLNFAHAELSALTALNLIHGAFMLIDHRIGDADYAEHDAENWAVRDILHEATERFQVALNVLSAAATRGLDGRP